MFAYCTYLTVYRGDKLPPFYIGKTSIKKIRNGYHGSVESKQYKAIWQQELKDHPELFDIRILTQHLTEQEAIDRELSFQKSLNVIQNPLYINQAMGRQCDNKGRKRSIEQKLNMSLAHMGQTQSGAHRQKIGLANKGKVPWNKGKKLSMTHRQNLSMARQRFLTMKEAA